MPAGGQWVGAVPGWNDGDAAGKPSSLTLPGRLCTVHESVFLCPQSKHFMNFTDCIPPSASSLREEGLERIAFFGRSLADYEAIFGVSRTALRGRRVLDVGGGTASFTAEATLAGIDATAVDPIYRFRLPAVRDRALRDFSAVQAMVQTHGSRYTMGSYGAEEPLWAKRLQTQKCFLDDFPAGFACGRYRGGGLPLLEFENRSFDLVLCSHLLFLYGSCLSWDFHQSALRELARVAREKVLIYPLLTLSGQPYARLDELRRNLATAGIESALEPVHHSVMSGADQRLVLFTCNQS